MESRLRKDVHDVNMVRTLVMISPGDSPSPRSFCVCVICIRSVSLLYSSGRYYAVSDRKEYYVMKR